MIASAVLVDKVRVGDRIVAEIAEHPVVVKIQRIERYNRFIEIFSEDDTRYWYPIGHMIYRCE